MRPLRSVIVILAIGGALQGQNSPLPVEQLLQDVNARLSAMSQQFESEVNDALGIFRSMLPSDRIRAVAAITGLVPWVSVFPKRFATLAVREKSQRSRRLVLRVIETSGDEASAPHLVALLANPEVAARDGLRTDLVVCIGKLGNQRMANVIRALLDKKISTRLRAAVLVALVRLKHAEGLDLARLHVAAKDVRLREAALEAIGLSGDSSRGLAALVVERVKKEMDGDVKATALRTLGGFPGNHKVLKVLHTSLGGPGRAALEATLVALARVGKRDLSQGPLLDFIERDDKDVPAELRDRAARLLLSWGSLSGVKAVVKPMKTLADKNSKNSDFQAAVGDRYRELGAYSEAIGYYKKALVKARLKSRIFVGMARCYARMRQFGKAKKALLDARYSDFSPFKDDEDFREMQESPEYQKLFRG